MSAKSAQGQRLKRPFLLVFDPVRPRLSRLYLGRKRGGMASLISEEKRMRNNSVFCADSA
jgi:hypothetical protein